MKGDNVSVTMYWSTSRNIPHDLKSVRHSNLQKNFVTALLIYLISGKCTAVEISNLFKY